MLVIENKNEMSEEIIEIKNGETLYKRQMKLKDLEDVDRLAQTEDYNIGLHNWKLFYETSPSTWFLIRNQKGDLVAYDSDNRLPIGDIRHRFQIVVRQDYRGYRISRFFQAMHYTKYPGVGNATSDSLVRYKLQKFGDKLVGYCGLLDFKDEDIKPNKEVEFFVEPIDQSHLDQLLDYDRSVTGFNRNSFTEEWVTAKKFPCQTSTLIARRDNKKFCGYGTIRECAGYVCISPVYADEEIIAERLLCELVRMIPKGTEIYVYFPATNYLLTEWVHKLKLMCTNTEIRYYMNNVPPNDIWDMNKVYAMHDYYPV